MAISDMRELSGHIMDTPSYVPTRLYFGNKSRFDFAQLLDETVREVGAKKVMLITGRHTSDKLPWLQYFLETMKLYPHCVFKNKTNNPTFDSIEEAIVMGRSEKVDLVAAIGGGSVLDTAKAVAAVLRQHQTLKEVITGGVPVSSDVPIIAVPTTAGTGSEVTSNASIWDDKGKRKYTVAHSSLYPRVSIVDPELTYSVPSHVTASTGLDTFAHALESCWSVDADEESCRFSLEAATLTMRYLKAAVEKPSGPSVRKGMALASVKAGYAIAKAHTTVSHAISYPLTAHYGVAHGHACGLSLGRMLVYNSKVGEHDCLDSRGPEYVRRITNEILGALGVETPQDACRVIDKLITSMGLKNFSQIDGLDVGLIANDALTYNRFKNNPREMDREQLTNLLHEMKGK